MSTVSQIQTMMSQFISVKISKILECKEANSQFLNYDDMNQVCNSLKLYWLELAQMADVPPEIEAACQMSLAVLAPSARERMRKLKLALGASSGVAGMASVIAAIATALGWGSGMVATVIAVFTGTSVVGPIAWLAGGALLLAIAGYFVVSSNDAKVVSDKAIEVLRVGVDKAVKSALERIRR